MKNRTLYFMLACLATTLTGCGNVRDDLGLGRASPDEFAVVDRAPLSMPPDFSLRPPQPGATRPQEVDLTKRANDIVFTANSSETASSSAGTSTTSETEHALLSTAGTEKADPNIRQIVDREAAQKVVGTEHLVDDLLWWHKKGDGATTVDAAGEAARLKTAKDRGEPVNKGATPIIERQKSGWLGL